MRIIGHAAAVTLTVAVVLVGSTASAQSGGGEEFSEPGVHPYAVPEGVQCLRAEVIGARGADGERLGSNGTDGGVGAPGGSVSATLQVTPGEELTIRVGVAGALPDDVVLTADGDGGPGGTGGGAEGGGGGGSSDVRQGGTGLEHRVLVGGGGGGGGAGGDSMGDPGGNGGAGGQSGADGNEGEEGIADTVPEGGEGATTEAAGAGGDDGVPGPGQEGAAGTGPDGGAGGTGGDGGGGGGGGYFGGGGGSGATLGTGAGGGGGSSFGPASATFASGVDAENDGHGFVRVSYQTGDTSCLPPTTTSAPVTTTTVAVAVADNIVETGRDLDPLLPALAGLAGGVLLVLRRRASAWR